MKARRRPFAGTLDSLMDTTTNVVGILVIVLVITQLGVTDAVNRIRASLPMVTAEQFEQQRAEAGQLRQTAETLAAQMTTLGTQMEIDESNIATANAAIDKLRAEIDAANQAKSDAQKQREELDAQTAKDKALATQLAQAKEELTRLKSVLAAAPQQPRPAPKQVHLPNPREAPGGAVPMVIVCKENRAMVVPIEGLRNLAESRIRQLRLPADGAGAIDGQKLVEYFDRVDVGNRQFRLRIRLHQFVPHLVFEPRPQAGDAIDTMTKPGSALRVDLHRADAKRQFARFLVWSDSFEAYIDARTLAEEARLLAGWEPMLPNQIFQISLADTIKVQRPPPPPPPPPPVNPPPVTPPSPAPTAPPKPPLPRDDID